MRRIALRFSDGQWQEIAAYAKDMGFANAQGKFEISRVVRDLVRRGLSGDRSEEAGYRSGYSEGQKRGFADAMKRLHRQPAAQCSDAAINAEPERTG